MKEFDPNKYLVELTIESLKLIGKKFSRYFKRGKLKEILPYLDALEFDRTISRADRVRLEKYIKEFLLNLVNFYKKLFNKEYLETVWIQLIGIKGISERFHKQKFCKSKEMLKNHQHNSSHEEKENLIPVYLETIAPELKAVQESLKKINKIHNLEIIVDFLKKPREKKKVRIANLTIDYVIESLEIGSETQE